MKFNTSLLRSSFLKTRFNEHSEVLFLTSSFCFDSPYQGEIFFKYSDIYNVYSRFTNPNLTILQNRLINIENAKFSLTTSSGMSSIILSIVSFLKPYDYLVTVKNLFGSTLNFFLNILFRFNILTRFVSFYNINLWFKSICINTKIFYIETPSNPLMDYLDIKNLSYITSKKSILLIIDNTFSTSILQRPLNLGADIVLSSCTKFLDGQGRILGGVITVKSKIIIKEIYNFTRIIGSVMSVFNAWIIFKSLETLSIRILKQSNNCLILFKLFRKSNIILKLYYSGVLRKQFDLFNFQQILGGSLLSFSIKFLTFEMGRIKSWKFINKVKFFSVTANLGDIRTIITHPSTTTHSSLSFIEKFLLGIDESLLRLSLGLEDIYDIYNDLNLILLKI